MTDKIKQELNDKEIIDDVDKVIESIREFDERLLKERNKL